MIYPSILSREAFMPRQHERNSYLTEIVLESASGKRQARISDICPGGCFVDTLTNVREGEEVLMSCTLETGHQLNVKGRVAYVMQGFGFGVSFTDIDSVSEAALQKMTGLEV
jgi:Tfp pilus assembly protein PilZ